MAKRRGQARQLWLCSPSGVAGGSPRFFPETVAHLYTQGTHFLTTNWNCRETRVSWGGEEGQEAGLRPFSNHQGQSLCTGSLFWPGKHAHKHSWTHTSTHAWIPMQEDTNTPTYIQEGEHIHRTTPDKQIKEGSPCLASNRFPAGSVLPCLLRHDQPAPKTGDRQNGYLVVVLPARGLVTLGQHDCSYPCRTMRNMAGQEVREEVWLGVGLLRCHT